MKEEDNVVAGIKLRTNHPTNLTFRQLYTWTIWQFPRRMEGGLLGAVRPPLADHGWYPAIIHVKDERTQVHGHLTEVFESPEAAAEHLADAK